MIQSKLLKFSKGNSKLGSSIYTVSMLSGFACPGADICKAKAAIDPASGKVKLVRGPNSEVTCFSASQEAQYPSVRAQRSHNFELLRRMRSPAKVRDLILASLPKKASIVRAHVAGDFSSQAIFDGWLLAAQDRPDLLIYAYTKSLPFWVARIGEIPANLVLTASMGGRYDGLIDQHDLRYARIVFSEREAAELGLEIDHDDSLARGRGPSFALLLHGPQAKGSKASKARSALRKAGFTGYSRK